MALEIGHEATDGVGRGLDGGLDSGPRVLDDDVEPLTIASASARLGIAPDAVRKRIRRGSLRAIKVDGCWRVLLGAEEAAVGLRMPVSRTRPVPRSDGPTAHRARGRGARLGRSSGRG